ncbi:MAG: glycosyltransferase family 4 protein [Sphingomonadales bacterium]|nr:glycosyltransferase family 4 protein [Sphingomonadales bacterium]
MSVDLANPSGRSLVLDVSRLIWRVWTGRLPTGIDKVCLAYLDHFGPRSLAMIQRGRFRCVLDPVLSDQLFALLGVGGTGFRRKLIALLAAMPLHRYRDSLAGKIYLNVGHTGLDASGFADWLRGTGMQPVFLIHDLIPITHPQYCRDGEDRRHARRIAQALDCAAAIIVNSRDTGVALERFAEANGYPLARTVVAWLGTDEPAHYPVRGQAARPYFAVVGTIEARKNHIMLLRVWQRLAARLGDAAPLLIVIGQRGWEADETFTLLDRAAGDGALVRELSRCSDAELRGWIAGARALLMPSHVEGYGLPAIEALQGGVPVIASDLAVYREVAGTIPLYLNADDEPAWEAAIIDFTGDGEDRNRQLRALGAFKAPTWEDHFAAVELLLEDLAR